MNIDRYLHPLNQAELLERGKEMAAIHSKLAELRERKKQFAKDIADEMEPLELRQHELSVAIMHKQEWRLSQVELPFPGQERGGLEAVTLHIGGETLPPVTPGALRHALDEVKKRRAKKKAPAEDGPEQ